MSYNIDFTTLKVNLYDNPTGDNGAITLSQSSADFQYLDIYYRSNDGPSHTGFVRVYSPNGKTPNLSVMNVQASALAIWIKSKRISIDGTNITNSDYLEWRSISGTIATSEANYIYITRVEGWKF